MSDYQQHPWGDSVWSCSVSNPEVRRIEVLDDGSVAVLRRLSLKGFGWIKVSVDKDKRTLTDMFYEYREGKDAVADLVIDKVCSAVVGEKEVLGWEML